MSPLAVLMPQLFALGVQVLIAAALSQWAGWVAKRHGGTRWRLARRLPLVALGVAVVGIGAGFVLLVAAADAQENLEMAATGLSRALWVSIPLASLAWGLHLTSAVLSTIGSLRRPPAQ